MILDTYKKTQEATQQKAEYFKKIDFPNIAAGFQAASAAMLELIEALEKVQAPEEIMTGEAQSSSEVDKTRL